MTIEEITQEVKGQGFFSNTDGFAKKAKEWVHNGTIIAQRISMKEGNIILVVERKTKFEVYRFFQFGDNWNVSADLSSGSPAEAFETIFKVI